ncbi:hypothetical protein D302_gp118 [Campylobacter phage CP30A]|uniref:Uncharacterized protein n=1 Tax=Campylobacter phage CP30A TaxID=1229752 RepID=J9SPD8_9CAUD|nr:hypothetical protein D302_gp118 [Campylobacter phage CP30A]AFR52430.1 hypothetical protein [Campylobacter phage CP30A]
MIINVSKNMFQEKMQKQGLSYGASDVLFDYITQLEDDIGEQIEFDPIAIMSDFSVAEGENELKNELENLGYFDMEGDDSDLDDAKQRAINDGVLVYEDDDYYVFKS